MSTTPDRPNTTGHGLMSCNPEAHDYASFVSSASPVLPLPPELAAQTAEQLHDSYQHCVRHCTPAMLALVQSDAPLPDDEVSPKLVRARELYQAWRAKSVPLFVSRR